MDIDDKVSRGTIAMVGIGPGAHDQLTPAALAAIENAELVVGYSTYIRLVAGLLKGKSVVKTGMTEEISRARAAVDAAYEGRRVAVISSGDSGVYGMATLVLEVLRERGWNEEEGPDFRMVPGITALSSCASRLGAPFGHDFCAISLSDLLTPWSVIEKRLVAAAAADFVVALYNPASGRRTRQIVAARDILLAQREATTPCALVKSAYRERETVVVTDLEHVLDFEIGMLTTVIVGSTQTYRYGRFMVTPRGYANKYDARGEVLPGQRPARSLVESVETATTASCWAVEGKG
jgi:precorrin-3B C17-methyltransferase